MHAVLMKGDHIMGMLIKTLLHHLQSIPAKQHLTEKGVIGKGASKLMHWEALADEQIDT